MFREWVTADYLQATQILLSAIEILVTAFVAIWIVQSIQRKNDRDRYLKEFFSKELIQLRADIRDFMKALIRGEAKARDIRRDHNALRIRILDLLAALNQKFKIDKKFLDVYRMALLVIIEGDKNYEDAFANNGVVVFKDETIKALNTLHLNNDHLFIDVLLKLYEAR